MIHDTRSTPAAARLPAPASEAPCVYFDGGCPLCMREIAAYRSAEGGASIRWVDVHRCEPGELGPGLERPAALQRLHVRAADGTLLSGAAAFVAIWERLPAFGALARVARWPGVLALLEFGYRVFLRIRPLWRR